MIVRKLPNGDLEVPARLIGPGVIADTIKLITPNDPEYGRWLPFVTEEAR